MFFFQYYGDFQHSPCSAVGNLVLCTYLNCIARDGLEVLDKEPEVRIMVGQRQGLHANAAPDIDNQRALRKVIPAVPCKIRHFEGKIIVVRNE
jgi:hypothetical protein